MHTDIELRKEQGIEVYHGTCSSPVVQDEYSYFLMTLNVYFKHNVRKILSEAGYVASYYEKYSLRGIISTIQNVVGATPQLVCSHGAMEQHRLCFYIDFKPRDCVINSSNELLASKSSCLRYISLP
ncbi:Ribonuclease T2-like [Macleaya cordata]|uniref:Ribonuclease T2-like n=1 Tax=Macleaya cordata TaxID=56857 RepID=A0A200QBK1_MACCD|nr:Ribonuclease T2-like [Macleaya cordata]